MPSDSEDSNLDSEQEGGSEQDSPDRYVPLPSSNPPSRARSPLSLSPDETDTHPLCAYMRDGASACVVGLNDRGFRFSDMYSACETAQGSKWYHEMITGATQPPVFDPDNSDQDLMNACLVELFKKWRSDNPEHALPRYSVEEHVF